MTKETEFFQPILPRKSQKISKEQRDVYRGKPYWQIEQELGHREVKEPDHIRAPKGERKVRGIEYYSK
jgi:hypothetical protein